MRNLDHYLAVHFDYLLTLHDEPSTRSGMAPK
jgi:hypothetical protein